VDDGRRVVARVHAIDRRAHDGGAEIAFGITLAHSLVDGVGEAPARHVDLLPQLDEAEDGAGVLAIGQLPGLREVGVVLQDLEDVFTRGRALRTESAIEGAEHVGLERIVRLHAELLDRVGDGARVDVAHGPFVLPVSIA
jgi:hypothetical protein